MITFEQKRENLGYGFSNPDAPANSLANIDYQDSVVTSKKYPLDSLRRSMQALLGLAIWPWSRARESVRPATDEYALLTQAFTKARITLGARMFEQGIDDGQTGAQIHQVTKHLVDAYGATEDIQLMRRHRDELFQRLADNALLDDAPLPGADVEYAAARRVQVRLARLRSNGTAATPGVDPSR